MSNSKRADSAAAEGARRATGEAPESGRRGKVRTAIRPFMECRQAHPEHEAALLEQANQALRYFARNGDMRWIGLLLCAGADPRSSGSVVDEQGVRPERYYPNAMERAAYGQTLDALKAFAPDSHRDDLTGMLKRAARSHNDTLISYLLDCGAEANERENYGSTALDRCMESLDITATHGRLNDLADRFEPVRTSTADRRWIGMCLRIECKELK